MRPNRTPPINATGLYELLSPWVDGNHYSASSSYRCEAIDGFNALHERGVDVFKKYYVPMGITKDIYRQDEEQDINLVTLMSADGLATVNVPSSFIKKFPNSTSEPYADIIVSFAIGVIPDTMDIIPTLERMAAVAELELGALGISDTGYVGLKMGEDVLIHKNPLSGFISSDEATVLENLRSAVSLKGQEALNETSDAASKEAIEAANAEIDSLKNIIITGQEPEA